MCRFFFWCFVTLIIWLGCFRFTILTGVKRHTSYNRRINKKIFTIRSYHFLVGCSIKRKKPNHFSQIAIPRRMIYYCHQPFYINLFSFDSAGRAGIIYPLMIHCKNFFVNSLMRYLPLRFGNF